jgi:hypothetical protein
MFRNRFFRQASLVLGLMFVLAAAAAADTVKLKDGSIYKGRIISFEGGRFTILIGEGARARQFTFRAEEVESIQFEQGEKPRYNVLVTDSLDKGAPAKPSPSERPVPSTTVAEQPPPDLPQQKPPSEEPQRAEPPPQTTNGVPPRSEPALVRTSGIGVLAKPIEISVKVLSDNTSNGWTNSGWVVKKGQRIRVVGSGQVSLGRGNATGPAGSYSLEDNTKLLKNVPTGALIAVIGDDNNDFIYIGADRTFTASRDGALFLGVNEGFLDDNSGSFDVRIEITPEG